MVSNLDSPSVSFVLVLSRYEAVYKTLQIRLWLRRLLGRWFVGGPVLKSKGLGLRDIRWSGVVVLVGEVWVVSLIGVVSI